MNRIRKYNNQYQVLITPHHRFHCGIELMLGNWTDSNLSDFKVETYNTWEDAVTKAYQLPDINWDQLVLFNKDNFEKILQVIKYEINVNNFDINLKPRLMTPNQIKETMFNRIFAFGERFRLGYHMNDVISFHITDQYTENLLKLSEIFSVNQILRITHKTHENSIIRLIGKTDMGTTYEIILWTTLIAQWGKWSSKNSNLPKEFKIKRLKEVEKQQKIIDNNFL